MFGKGSFYKEVCHRVNIASNRMRTELQRLAESGAAAHKRVKNYFPLEAGRSIECLHYIGSGRRQRAKGYSPKNGAKTLRPPFMDVVYGSIDFFPPALDLGNVADFLERKVVILQGARAGKGSRQVFGGGRVLQAEPFLVPVHLPSRRISGHLAAARPYRDAMARRGQLVPCHIGMTISTSTRRDSSTAARSWNAARPPSTRSRSR